MLHNPDQNGSLDFSQYPYLERVEKLRKAYPALGPLIDKLKNSGDQGRRLIAKRYSTLPGNAPGRCAVLVFHDRSVEHVATLESANDLSQYMANAPPAQASDPKLRRRRLFILEDMEPGFVNTLGLQLGVNPLIFSEQMNTWNFTDSRSVSHRSLPSAAAPENLFTLRYYELRTLDERKDVSKLKTRMTFAINRRKAELWHDIELPSIAPDNQHAFIRRCASFWTPFESHPDHWDAVILVDPPMDSCEGCTSKETSINALPSSTCQPSCMMLEDPKEYKTRKGLWQARKWTQEGSVRAVRHMSKPYHGGVATLIRPFMCYAGGVQRTTEIANTPRNQASPFDELIFYWTKCANTETIEATKLGAVNSAYYLLKFVAATWDSQVEFISYSVANSGWFKDDYEAGIGIGPHESNWKNELLDIAAASKDINDMRRKISQFQQAMTLNLERVGMQLGAEALDPKLPLALRNAQKDFLATHSRLMPLRTRIDDLSGITNELSSLRAAFKSIEDGAHNLKLSLFLAIIFPLTLVASVLSMGGDYLPGEENFWVFWASSIPLAFIIGVAMMYNRIWAQWNKFMQRGKDAWDRYVEARQYKLKRVSTTDSNDV